MNSAHAYLFQMPLNNVNSWIRLCPVIAACGLIGCSRFSDSHATDSSATPSTRSSADSQAHAAAAGTTSADTATTVTATGYGALRIGMTITSAATALHSPVPDTAGLDTNCTYVRFAHAPAGMRVMFASGTLARIDVDTSAIATGRGARVGDSEAHVRELYGSRVSVEPHKYVQNGHYLIIAPTEPTDSAFRLLFETDGSRVTSYRGGRLPQVRWVEGCA